MSWQSPNLSCDAPSYAIVKACRLIGVHNPEDVRWCRWRHGPPSRWSEWLHPRTWKKWLGQPASANRCTCGQPLPEPARCTFTFADGREVDYLIGQCGRCRTVYWDPSSNDYDQNRA